MIVAVPPMKLEQIYWGRNTPYATRRATMREIEDVLLGRHTSFRRNLRGRAATHLAIGRTSDGRPLSVAFIYVSNAQTAVPINAWEAR